MTPEERRRATARDMAKRGVPHGAIISLAEDAIEALMAAGGFLADTKQQFAVRMDWFLNDRRTPNVRLVEDVCNLTRDQIMWPETSAQLGGMIVAYAPSVGGMTLIDPTGDLDKVQLTSIIAGEMQRARQAMTERRRRLPIWDACADSFLASDDKEMGKLMAKAANEIEVTGSVADSLMGKIWAGLRSRGLL